MIRILFALLALLWPATLPAGAPAEPVTPAMWEATLGKSKLTLFGTVHTLPRGVDWFRPHVVRALDSADRLVLEAQVPEGPGAALPTVMRLARLPAPRPALQRMPESWQPVYKAAVDRLKPGPLDWYDTWFIALSLANLQAQQDGLDPRIGVEAVLTERARIRNIPIQPLETMEEQLIYFDALTEADQQQMLLSTLEGLDNSRDRMAGLVADWLAGRTDVLAQKVNADFERTPMLRRMLLEDRNQRWADWIVREMKRSPGHMFVAVGAGHLAGGGSLIADLEARGLKVKPVLQPPPPRQRRPRR
ncbi:MAG: TraB/GumN family protein [Sandarakinorhabdus sp.]|nr:TraB/GumN family protein [Sandarakinorhabdus sp.]